MQAKLIARSTSFALFALTPLLGMSCKNATLGPEPLTECPAGQVRAADRCIPANTVLGVFDGGERPDMGRVDPPDSGPQVIRDAETNPRDSGAGGGAVGLPFFVEDHFVMSGFMGGGQIDSAPCTGQTGSRGPCRRITWTPGGQPWVGFYFQFPENNWTMPGLSLQGGAKQVRFRVWGATGTESMNFAAGIRAADGFQLETGYAPLTTTPTVRRIDLSAVNYDKVTGAFAWFIENPRMASSVTVYIDDLEWTNEPVGGPAPDAGTVVADAGGGGGGTTSLPFWIDDHYVMSGFMGGGQVTADDCPTNPGDPAPCRRITWTPGAAPWSGFYFQYPENNWGMQPGLMIAPGAQRVSFYAWGATGTESLNFASGIQAADGFQIESGYRVMTTTRTRYTIDISAARYTDVAGAFAWFVNNPNNAASVTFYLDDLRWE